MTEYRGISLLRSPNLKWKVSGKRSFFRNVLSQWHLILSGCYPKLHSPSPPTYRFRSVICQLIIFKNWVRLKNLTELTMDTTFDMGVRLDNGEWRSLFRPLVTGFHPYPLNKIYIVWCLYYRMGGRVRRRWWFGIVWS